MSKMDITINRKMTINTGNYSSIGPSVSLTLKDVETKDIADKYQKLSQAMDIFMLAETISLGNEAESIHEMGYKKYLREIEKVDRPIDLLTDILKSIDNVEITVPNRQENIKIL